MKVLVVTNPFNGHEKGYRITNSAEIEEIQAGEHAHHVVQADHDIELAVAEKPPETTQEA